MSGQAYDEDRDVSIIKRCTMEFNHHIVISDGWERTTALKHQIVKSSGAFRDPRVSSLRE